MNVFKSLIVLLLVSICHLCFAGGEVHPYKIDFASTPGGSALGIMWICGDTSGNIVLRDDVLGSSVSLSTLAAGGVTDHGGLTGLADDDHSTYPTWPEFADWLGVEAYTLGLTYQTTGSSFNKHIPIPADPAGMTVLGDHTTNTAIHYYRPAEIRVVSKTDTGRGGEYSTIQDAIDSITDSGASKPYAVIIYPGVYSEQITLNKSNISLIGIDRESCVVQAPGGNYPTITLAASWSGEIAHLTIKCNYGSVLGRTVIGSGVNPLFYDCEFESDLGAIIQITGGVWRFHKCRFYGNGTSPGAEEVVFLINGGYLYVSSCEFENAGSWADFQIVKTAGATTAIHFNQCRAPFAQPMSTKGFFQLLHSVNVYLWSFVFPNDTDCDIIHSSSTGGTIYYALVSIADWGSPSSGLTTTPIPLAGAKYIGPVDIHNSLKISGTEVIDASRNATFATVTATTGTYNALDVTTASLEFGNLTLGDTDGIVSGSINIQGAYSNSDAPSTPTHGGTLYMTLDDSGTTVLAIRWQDGTTLSLAVKFARAGDGTTTYTVGSTNEKMRFTQGSGMTITPTAESDGINFTFDAAGGGASNMWTLSGADGLSTTAVSSEWKFRNGGGGVQAIMDVSTGEFKTTDVVISSEVRNAANKGFEWVTGGIKVNMAAANEQWMLYDSGGTPKVVMNSSTGNIYTSGSVQADGNVSATGSGSIGTALYLEGGNVTYVPLGGDIQAYATAATAGDTLVLASGKYTITGTITIDKQLNIVGRGNAGFATVPVTPGHGTLISCATSGVTALYITSDNVRIANLSIDMTGTNSLAINTANNLSGIVFSTIDVIIDADGPARGFSVLGSKAVFRNLTFYVASSDNLASGIWAYNDASTTQNAVVDCFNVTGTCAGGSIYSAPFVCLNDTNPTYTITMNLSGSVCQSLSGTPIDAALSCSSAGGSNNAIINAYFCTLDGADYDAYQTGTNEMNLGGSELINDSTLGTVTYRGMMASGGGRFGSTLYSPDLITSLSAKASHTDYATSDPVTHADYTTSDPVTHADYTTSDPVTHSDYTTSDPVTHADYTTSDPVTHADYLTSDPVTHTDLTSSGTLWNYDNTASPTTGQVLEWNMTQWEPGTDDGAAGGDQNPNVGDGSTTVNRATDITFTEGSNITIGVAEGGTSKVTVTISSTGGSGASTGTQRFFVGQAGDLSDGPTPSWNSTGYSQYLLFDDSTDEDCYYQWQCPDNWDGGNVYCKLVYTMASATATSTVVWGVAVMCMSDGDSADMDTASFDTATTVSVSVPTAGYPDVYNFTLTNDDSMAAGDIVFIKIFREAADPSDTASGDAELRMVELEFGRS